MSRTQGRRRSRRFKVVQHGPRWLDVFSEQDLKTWAELSEVGQLYSDGVYFDLEKQRAQNHDALCAALQDASSIEVEIDNWVRLTDYRWSLTPLSPAGSIRNIGQRFNIGEDLERARDQFFPALYIGQTFETGLCEFFGAPLGDSNCGMPLNEMALRRDSSFTTFKLRGHIEHVLDLTTYEHLKPFADIIRRFNLSVETKRFAIRKNLKPRILVTTPYSLWKRVLMPPAEWRQEPNLYGIPASSQIFGRLVRDAGFEAIRYPSQQGGELCLAVFNENFVGGSSRIEVIGNGPDGASCTILDSENLCLDGMRLSTR